jgi:23S rRNA (cytosine1962-C5)-methyltransferase
MVVEETGEQLLKLLEAALNARRDMVDPNHETAIRLFNGFYEGLPELVIDLLGRSLVFHNYARPPQTLEPALKTAHDYLLTKFPWVRAVLLKSRHADRQEMRRGELLSGGDLDRRIREHGVWYALDLRLNQDAGFYLDTRNLRRWALDHLQDKTVLNTFAYTGSLGVACLCAGARRVVQLDRSRKFLALAKASYRLNGIPAQKAEFLVGDFFQLTSRLRRNGELFDCVFIDPPFFATNSKGTVDLVKDSQHLVNKVRPLVSDGGWLVAVNNALFVSGTDYLRRLEGLCGDGYLSIEELLPVPADVTGYPHTHVSALPADPSPFNHPTKIAVLRVRRKT